MKRYLPCRLPGALFLVLVGACGFIHAAEDTTVLPEAFTGSDKVLSKAEEIKFWIYRDQVTVKKMETKGAEGSVAGRLFDSDEKFGPWPHTPAQLRQMLGMPATDVDDKVRQPLDGIFERPLEIGAPDTEPKSYIGPFRLRKAFEDWNKDLGDVSGATLSYEDNRLTDTSTWNSGGTLIYPIILTDNEELGSTSRFLSYDLAVLPSITWKFADVSSGSSGDVEELQFQVPIFFGGNHRLKITPPPPGAVDDPNFDPGAAGSPNQFRSELSLSPFYLTDLDFEGATVGASLTYEPIFQIGEFDVGQYHSVSGDRSLAYLVRLQAKADYGNVLEGSEYISRPEDESFARMGAKVELGFRPFGKSARWEIKGIYHFMYDLTDSDNEFSDLWEAKSTFWLDEKQHAGVTLSYQVGETPVAAKDIDSITVGLEVKL